MTWIKTEDRKFSRIGLCWGKLGFISCCSKKVIRNVNDLKRNVNDLKYRDQQLPSGRTTAKLALIISTPSPKVAKGSDRKGVVMSSTNADYITRQTTNPGRLVCIDSHAHLGSGQSESTMAAISEAHHSGAAAAAHPSRPVQPGNMDPTTPPPNLQRILDFQFQQVS